MMSAPVEPFQGVYRGARVLVTGHTGFKGAWLCEWLLRLGAEVFGLALAPDTKPSLFNQLNLADRLHHRLGDIREAPFRASGAIREVLRAARPDFIFHLAAQSLVRRSYAMPVATFDVNVMGTVNVLEALRLAGTPATVVCVTTDKCYDNSEQCRPFRETDPLGGRDPYSASKAAAEIAIAAYRSSFFNAPDSPVRVASGSRRQCHWRRRLGR